MTNPNLQGLGSWLHGYHKKNFKIDVNIAKTRTFWEVDENGKLQPVNGLQLDLLDIGAMPLSYLGTRVPELDIQGHIKSEYIPKLYLTEVFVVNSEAERDSISTQTGDVVVVVYPNGTKKNFMKTQDGDFIELGYSVDVHSVNGKSGVVVLDADDIGETPFRIWFTNVEKQKLLTIEPGAQQNVQSDWAVSDPASDAYIKNKPIFAAINDTAVSTTTTYSSQKIGELLLLKADSNHTHPASEIIETPNRRFIDDNDRTALDLLLSGFYTQVQTDWLETDTTKKSYILNKPVVPTALSQLTNDLNLVQIDDNQVVPDKTWSSSKIVTYLNGAIGAITGGSATLTGLTDTAASPVGGRFLQWNAGGTTVEYVTISADDVDDTNSAHKFVTQAQLDKIDNCECNEVHIGATQPVAPTGVQIWIDDNGVWHHTPENGATWIPLASGTPTTIAAPILTSPTNNSTVNTTTPTILGSAPANSTVEIFVNGSSAGTATATASGTFTFTIPSGLTDGQTYTVNATATDGTNTSVLSNNLVITIDTSQTNYIVDENNNILATESGDQIVWQ